MKLEFNGDFLAQDKVAYNHEPIVNIYTVYELIPFANSTINTILENGLFGAVKLTKNADIDEYKCSGYGTGYDSRGSFSHPSGGFDKNVIIFGAYMSNSVHVDNKKKDILIFGKGPTQGLDNTTLTAENMYSTNFTVANKFFF